MKKLFKTIQKAVKRVHDFFAQWMTFSKGHALFTVQFHATPFHSLSNFLSDRYLPFPHSNKPNSFVVLITDCLAYTMRDGIIEIVWKAAAHFLWRRQSQICISYLHSIQKNEKTKSKAILSTFYPLTTAQNYENNRIGVIIRNWII